MYCKKCKFHSFDHVSTCPKCGVDWEESRKSLYLNWLSASGVNWLERDATQAATAAPAMAMSADKKASLANAHTDYLSAPVAAPAAPTARASVDTGIDVSSFPELDFAMPEAEPAPAANTPAPARSAPRPEEDLFLETLPAEDTVELDFSASFDTPADPQQAQAKPKREDLFIPELEEMLAPLEDEPRAKTAAPKKPSFSEEQEILLDFGTESSGKKASDSNDELSFLSLEDPKKP
jgi:hypothetical protein